MIEVRPLTPEELDHVDSRLPLHRLNQPEAEFLIAWDGGEPVGHACLDSREDPPQLQDVYVPEEHRRRGIATELSRAAEELVRSRGYTRIALDVDVENTAARALYERLGYREAGTPPRHQAGTIMLRGEPFSFDVHLLDLVKDLE
jgi:ribosomal protein S18 acetylase RimI-like enzyme